jgi:hypothetical protein
MNSKILLPVTLLAAMTAHAADPTAAATPAQQGVAEQRLRQDMQTLLTHMAMSGVLGQNPQDVRVHLQQPAQRVSDLGVLVDSASAERARDGLRVLGTTPGSTAERLGLRPGDMLVGVNGTSLRNLGATPDGSALAATTLRSVVDALPDSAPLQLDVQRAGNLWAMNTSVHSVLLPALSVELGAGAMAAVDPPVGAGAGGCGRISTFDVAPRGEHQYHARIWLLDGTTPGPSGHETYRVAAGEHRLVVSEDIPTQEMGSGTMASAARTNRDTHKELIVNVKPNTTAMVAAQFHTDKATNFAKAEYWDPVVWREIPEGCP